MCCSAATPAPLGFGSQFGTCRNLDELELARDFLPCRRRYDAVKSLLASNAGTRRMSGGVGTSGVAPAPGAALLQRAAKAGGHGVAAAELARFEQLWAELELPAHARVRWVRHAASVRAYVCYRSSVAVSRMLT